MQLLSWVMVYYGSQRSVHHCLSYMQCMHDHNCIGQKKHPPTCTHYFVPPCWSIIRSSLSAASPVMSITRTMTTIGVMNFFWRATQSGLGRPIWRYFASLLVWSNFLACWDAFLWYFSTRHLPAFSCADKNLLMARAPFFFATSGTIKRPHSQKLQFKNNPNCQALISLQLCYELSQLSHAVEVVCKSPGGIHVVGKITYCRRTLKNANRTTGTITTYTSGCW